MFVPIHWNRQFASSALACNLIAPVVDPVSGQPEAKHGTATVRPLIARWQARVMNSADSEKSPETGSSDYWSRQVLPNSRAWWLAGTQPMDWPAWGEACFGRQPELVMHDASRRRFRAVWVNGGRLEGVLLVEPSAESMPALDWLDGCFGERGMTPEQRRSLLVAGTVDAEDHGPVVCSCFQVGERQISQAIAQGFESVEALSDQLKCGSNCGSCIPEIRGLLTAALAHEPA